MKKNKKLLIAYAISLGILSILIVLIIISFIKSKNKTVEKTIIKEETFLTQLNHILLNKDKYINSEITLEGIFYEENVDGETLYSIYRNTPGDCGNDGLAGFDVDCSQLEIIPENNSWVKATGTLKYNVKDNITFLILKLTQIEELPKRGKEFVIN